MTAKLVREMRREIVRLSELATYWRDRFAHTDSYAYGLTDQQRKMVQTNRELLEKADFLQYRLELTELER